MNKTQNFQLNQWDAADRVQRADFNADNAALENALTNLSNRCNGEDASISSLNGSVASLSARVGAIDATRPLFETGSYVGNGTYGPEHPITLTFSFQPKLVIAQREYNAAAAITNNNYLHNQTFILIRPLGMFFSADFTKVSMLSWNGNSVSWYSEDNPNMQLNRNGDVVNYLAFG